MIGHSRKPSISIVVPAKDESGIVIACIEGILAQTLREQVEIIVIDSGSTDAILERMAKYPVCIRRIQPEEFNHGRTRNLGAQIAQGEFVVMTVQDARPADDYWLQRMLQHFDDPAVAGVCGLQFVPHDFDKNPLEWFRPSTKPAPRKLCFPDPAEFAQLSPREQLALSNWDDVTAMYRRSALLEQPFDAVGFSEDQLWARKALARGWALVYEPRAQVTHYHNQNFSFRFRRTFTRKYVDWRNFGCLPRGKALCLSLAYAFYHLGRYRGVRRKPKWLLYNFRLILADWLACRSFSVVLYWKGEVGLERLHSRLCRRPPQASSSAAMTTSSRQVPQSRNESAAG